MDRYSGIVFGYHGTDPALAERLVRGELAVADWRPSTNPYDWLGHGIYFWESAPDRARAWANKGGRVGAVIRLGECLDLTDISFGDMLADSYRELQTRARRRKKRTPENRGKRHDLDCAVINLAVSRHQVQTGRVIQTVRGASLEGDPIFPGSALLRETHIQIAVRDPSWIIGGFRPT